MNLFVCQELTAEQQQWLLQLPQIGRCHFYQGTREDEPIPIEFQEAEVCFGNPPAQWLTESHQLRWIQLISVGFGEYLGVSALLQAQGVCLTNLQGFFRVSVAESILASILGLYRKLDQLVELKTQRTWLGDELRESMRTLQGRRVVLFGRGEIHQQLRHYLAPFKCPVVVFGSDWEKSTFEEELKRAEVVVSTVPATPRTDHIFDRHRLSLLPPSAIFLNFGRSNVVDPKALAQALREGTLSGAVLDVTDEEPLASNDPLWTVPNLILSQHTAGGMQREIEQKLQLFQENWLRFQAGEPLRNMIDFQRGY